MNMVVAAPMPVVVSMGMMVVVLVLVTVAVRTMMMGMAVVMVAVLAMVMLVMMVEQMAAVFLAWILAENQGLDRHGHRIRRHADAAEIDVVEIP